MPLYMYRWINGDISFVRARSKREAVKALDEMDYTEGCSIILVLGFMVPFVFTDEAELG